MGRVIGFIPVRAGSKSIPGKNIREFCDKPLVFWTVNALNNCEHVDAVFVSTDGAEIRNVVQSFGFGKVAVVGRSPESATDTASTESALIEFVENFNFRDDDRIILVQATSPLIESEDIARGIKLAQSQDGSHSVLSAVKTKRFFWTADGRALNYDFTKRPRRQDFDGMYMENGAFYISTVGKIRASKCRISEPILVCETPECTSIELDEPIDWQIAESILNERINSSPQRQEGLQVIKAILMDVDGVLTDSGMFYSEDGDESKKFNTRDGMGVELARKAGLITGIITSENTKMVERRANKMGVRYVKQGAKSEGKLRAAIDICHDEGIDLQNVAYIGDDINCKELLSAVGYAACPFDAVQEIKMIPGINVMKQCGGQGVVRELVEIILSINRHLPISARPSIAS